MNIFASCVKRRKWNPIDQKEIINEHSCSRNNHTIKAIKVLGDTNWAIKTVLKEEKKIRDHKIPVQMDDIRVISSDMNKQENYFQFYFFGYNSEYISTIICVSVSWPGIFWSRAHSNLPFTGSFLLFQVKFKLNFFFFGENSPKTNSNTLARVYTVQESPTHAFCHSLHREYIFIFYCFNTFSLRSQIIISIFKLCRRREAP